MGAKSKSGKIRGAARKLAAMPPDKRGRGPAGGADVWEPQLPDESDDEIDCQRIIQGDGRSLPLYYDDYN